MRLLRKVLHKMLWVKYLHTIPLVVLELSELFGIE